MTEVPLRIKVEFVDREARAGIERLKRQTRTALDPMQKAAIKVRASLKKLGIEGDRAGKKIKTAMTGGAFAIRGIATEMEHALRTLVFGITAVTAAGGLLGRQAVNMSAEFEVLQITFESLTGSISQADKLIRDMKEFAVKTPLQLRDIEEAGTILLAFGERAADVIPILNLLGEAATAMNKPLEQFIRVRNLLAQGVVLSRMLAPLGISRDILAEFGAGAGATGAELVAAFDEALGRFEGLFVRTFDTIRGRLSNLKDELDIMFAALGDPLRDVLIESVDQITGFLSQVRKFFEENKDLIEDAFRKIKASAEAFLAPITDVLGKFFADLRDNPEKIQELADAFINLSRAATRLLIFGTVTVVFLKFVAAVTLLRISLPHLLATLGLSVKAVGGLRLAFTVLNPWALAITAAVTLITGALILHNELVIKAAEKTVKLREEMEDQLESLEAVKVGVDGLTSTYHRLKDSTKTNEEKFAELRNEMQLIINLHPEFLRQLGLTETTSGQLVTAFGTVIDTWEELEGAWLHADTSHVVGEINNITTALQNLSRQEFMRQRTFRERVLEFFVGTGAVLAEKEQQWFDIMTGRLAAEQPDMLGRFFQQFPGAAPAEDITGITGGRKVIEDLIDKAQELRDAQGAFITFTKRGTDRWIANMEEWNRAQREAIQEAWDISRMLNEVIATALGLQRTRDLARMIERRGFPSELRFDPTAAEGLMFRVIDPMRDQVEEIKKISDEFINNLSRTLGDFLADWGLRGGKPDLGRVGLNILEPAAKQWGIDLAALWKTGGFTENLFAGAIMGGAGFIAGRLMGEEPLKIEQPVDIRIVDIETRLKNFFNFRGLGPFIYESGFKQAFEQGLY